MVKLTKRKGFNFFRSYFDVYNELENNQDKVDFIDALLNRQFLGAKPTNLKGMAKFAYISQTNSIDSQVKGYEDKTNTTLSPLDTAITTPTVPPTDGGQVPPSLQVQVEVEEKVEEKDKDRLSDFEIFWETYNKKVGRKDVERKFLSLSQKDVDKILRVVKIYVDSVEPKWKKLPKTWLNGEHWNDEITSVKKVSYSGKQKIFL
tara:strand:- start:201 stop:812 length:612 start_codon:yes stop_codon:yes gene_type:complete